MHCNSISPTTANTQHSPAITGSPAPSPSGGLHPQTAQMPDWIQQTLIGQVRAIRNAAVPGAMLEFATTIANEANVLESAHLAALVASPANPESQIECAADDLRAWRVEDAEALSQSFRQLAQCKISPPHNITAVFEHGLPFDKFREMVDVGTSRLLPLQIEKGTSGLHLHTQRTIYEEGLRALNSPIGLALLRNPRITPDMLFEQLNLIPPAPRTSTSTSREDTSDAAHKVMMRLKRVQRLNNLGAPPQVAAHPGVEHPPGSRAFPATNPGEHTDRTVQDKSALKNVAHFGNPEKVWKMLDFLPDGYCEHLFSLGGLVPWPVLEKEIDRAIGQYDQDEGPIDFFWAAIKDKNLARKDEQRLEQSRQNMAPYLSLEDLRPRLHVWTAGAPRNGTQPAELHIEHQDGDKLLERWTSLGIPPAQQVSMGQFMVQGFDENWARDIVQSSTVRPAHLQAWFRHGYDMDLGVRRDDTMKAGIARRLADDAVSPDMLALVPAMTQCGLSAELVDHILDSVSYERAEAVFGPEANTWQQIRYGLDTPDQLFQRLAAGIESVNDLKQAAQRDLGKISELRKETADTRDQLRRKLRAMENLLADLPAATPCARRCASIAAAWREAITILDAHLLQPSLESHSEDQLEQITHMLTTLDEELRANPAFQTAPADEPQPVPEFKQFA